MSIRSRVMEYVRIVPVVFALLFVSTLPMMPNAFFWAENNSDVGYSFRWLGVPALALSFWLLGLRRIRSRLKTWERYLVLPFLAAFFVLIMNGPVLLLNAWLQPQVAVVLEGTVVEKVSASIKSKARIVFVDQQNVSHRWPVSRRAYDAVGLGDRFRVHAARGGLGILYVNSGDDYWKRIPAAEPQVRKP